MGESRTSWADPLDLRVVRSVRPAVRALRVLHPTRVEGLDNLPAGGALLVGNHGLLGYETLLFFEALFTETGRMPRGLADRWFFRVPVLRTALLALGGLRGEPGNALRLLRAEQLVVCYPGGAREVFKHSARDRYRLRWEKSAGFARVALRAGVPIVPFAAAGVDDTYTVVDRIRGSGKLWAGHEKYDLPRLRGPVPFVPLPAPVPFWFRLGEPIEPGALPEAAEDERAVSALHGRAWRASQALLDALVREWRHAFGETGEAAHPGVRSAAGTDAAGTGADEACAY